MAMAIDPIDDSLNFVIVVLLGEQVVGRPIRLARVSRGGRIRATVDLRRKILVDTFAGWTGQCLVGRMFIRPCGPQTMPMNHLENGVHMQVLVGEDRRAVRGINRQI